MSQAAASGPGGGSGSGGGGAEKRPKVVPLNRAELTLTIPQIPAHLPIMMGGQGVSMMDMSPAADGYRLPSPSFNNFMLTLSPLMQLSSPQATMSPREDNCGLGCGPAPAVPSAM